jgi:hypothetical protein
MDAMSVIVRLVIVAFSLLLVATPARAQATPPRPGSVSVSPPPTAAEAGFQGFSIVLVLGDVQDGATSDNIPAGARAALGDLRDFLPYRSYRVLDTAWVLASSQTRQAVNSRLQGPDEQDYEITLDRMPLPPSSLQVRFAMREPDRNAERRAAVADREAALKAELQELVAAHSALESQLRKAEGSQNRGDADALRQRLADTEIAIETRQRQGRYAPGGATLIDTSFTMSLGETVVVGTSRMRGGNKALIVLLTAATRGGKPRE